MRTKYSILNVATAWIGQLSVLLFQLLNRFVFVRTLSAEYLGVSGLFTNVLSLLSFAELGVGAAMVFSLYVPLVQQDSNKIKSLMRFYRNAYRVIGCVILVCGLLMLPIYPVFISETPNIEHLDLIYMLYVVNSAITYFYSYKRSLIIADQKKYVDSIVYYSRSAVVNILQVLILLITHSCCVSLSVNLMKILLFRRLLTKCILFSKTRMYPTLEKMICG